jgi:LAO/AO transport system kinase
MSAKLVSRARAGDRKALGRLITKAENRVEGINAHVVAHVGQAHIVGIAGAPGTGKSCLIDALIGAYRRAGRSVAVVAIDPSGEDAGALLGDRIRVRQWATDPEVYVRSMASRGHPGGLAPSTPLVLRILDACGFNVILVEAAVLSEDVIEQSDTLVLVVTPESGDAVQLLKNDGIREADLLVVNKADQSGVGATLATLREMTERPVLSTVATTRAGADDLRAAIDRCAPADPKNRRFLRRMTCEIESLTVDIVREQLVDAPDLAARVMAGKLDPFVAAQLMTGNY